MTTAAISPVAAALVDAMALRLLDPADPAPASATSTPASVLPPLQPTAIETALQTAASRQDGLGPLLADLAVAVQAPDLPAPVQAAAAKVLALRQPLETPPTGQQLQQALAQSGLMLEARLAAEAAAPDDDLKAALLILLQALESAPAGPAKTAAGASRPAPPYRGGPVQAQAARASTLAADASTDVLLQRLAQGAGAALARQTMMQAASAPGSPAAQTPQWLFEIPFMVPPGAAIAQFEIGRDEEEHTSPTADEAEPTWRARFSLDLDPMGPVHARISLRGGRIRVSLWAERGATAAQLNAQRDALAQALLGDDLIAQIAVFPGAPEAPRPAAGKFVDRAL